jgi:hypothetical protein
MAIALEDIEALWRFVAGRDVCYHTASGSRPARVEWIFPRRESDVPGPVVARLKFPDGSSIDAEYEPFSGRIGTWQAGWPLVYHQ